MATKSSSAALTPKLTRIARLKQLQAERGLQGPAELGRAIGRKTNQTSDLLHGRAAFGERVARDIEQLAGLPSGWLDRAEPESRSSPAAGADADPSVVVVRPLPGPAAAGAQLPVKSPLLLAADWVRVAASPTRELHYLHAPDDSLAPLLVRGDLLLVDAAVRSFGRDGVYVLRAGERLLLRQLRARLDGRIDVSTGSAASSGTSEVADAGALSVLAQAVWVWRGHPL